MKETGINYFYDLLGLYSGSFAVYYTFEDGAGNAISSVSGGQSLYSGLLNTVGSFWSSPGSGTFTGNSIQITNASGLQSSAWTDVFLYEKVDTNPAILLDSLGGGSGYRIGITSANKPYFESFNQEPIIVASLNQFSSKNAISVTYMPNYVTMGYYDFNAKTVEAETFDFPFQVAPSDLRYLGGQFTGYMDTYIHLTEPVSPDVLGQLFSGFWAIPTGTTYPVTQVCTTGITGYQNVFVGETGVTGYSIAPGGDLGRDYFTGQFPTFNTTSYLSGYLSSGLYSSGVSGDICYPVTGDPVTSFQYLTGYASSFGMQKVEFISYVASSDVVKQAVSYTPFDSLYNVQTQRQYSGYYLEDIYGTGLINSFLNGLGQADQGWYPTGSYIIVSGATDSDTFFFDVKQGDRNAFSFTTGTGFAFTYSGQEIFLNGLNLISGYDFVVDAGSFALTNANTGITGVIFEYPIVLESQTGSYSVKTGVPFWRNTTNLYLNGLRQRARSDYVEGALFDLLSGTSFNPSDCSTVYDNNDLYWE